MGTIAEMLSTPLGVVEWFVYLLAAVMFVIGLHLMNSPKTARKGNMVSAIGMILAVVMAFIVLFAGEISNGFQHGVAVVLLIAGIIIGAVAGVVSAKKVKMTDMPQLVSVFNTVGGGAAAPPPTVLNTDTSCGMSVILTFLAETTPATAPMMMPAISSTTATPCWKPLEISPANSTMNAMTTARIMPMAETILPLRAVFGEFIRCRPITNITAASR